MCTSSRGNSLQRVGATRESQDSVLTGRRPISPVYVRSPLEHVHDVGRHDRTFSAEDRTLRKLTDSANNVAESGNPLSPEIQEEIARIFPNWQHERPPDHPPLTVRQREVLQFLAEGMGVRDIAYRLFLSIKTIETYRQQVMDKLDIHSIAGLTKYAIRYGITTLDG